ncbi:MAG: 50S ribosomal protein L32 [Patescibacteria group bacterium]
MVVRMRRNRSQTKKRRSHHALKSVHISKDEAGNSYLSHRVNPVTGMYRGRQVIDVTARAKRVARRTKRREKELMASGQSTGEKKAATSSPSA